ncbi:hypothetical protein BHE74_00031149, partial [Ensete ventricosum]
VTAPAGGRCRLARVLPLATSARTAALAGGLAVASRTCRGLTVVGHPCKGSSHGQWPLLTAFTMKI